MGKRLMTTYKMKHKDMRCPICGKDLIECVQLDDVACPEPMCKFNEVIVSRANFEKLFSAGNKEARP